MMVFIVYSVRVSEL